MFFVFFAVLLLVIAALAYTGAGWCLGKAGQQVQRGIIWFNALLILLTACGRGLYNYIGMDLARAGLLLLTPLLLTEIFFGLGVLAVRIWGAPLWLLRRLRGGRRAAEGTGEQPADPERRKFIFGTALAAGSLAASGYGTAGERCRTVVNHYDVPQKDLPAELEGFTVAQLSDVHLGMFYTLEEWRTLLEQTAALGTDVLAVTGDLFDDDDINEEAAVILDEYVPRFPKGIYFCYGNHEHFRNIRRTRAALAKTKVHVLVNEAECVAGEKTARPLWFVGVDYPSPRPRFKEIQEKFTAKAFAQVPKEAVNILLAHHPDFIDDGAEHNSALVLTGHTHGGQFGACGVPLVPYSFKYMRGLYRVGNTLGYVHNGNGSWFPFRLGCPPEIAVFRLRREN